MATPSNDRPQIAATQAWPSPKSRVDGHQHQGNGQAAGAFAAASTLMSGIMAISVSQIMGAPLKFLDPKTYRAYMAWTKENFAILMTAVTEWWAPTLVRVSGDESMRGQLYQMRDGSLRCNFPHRIVLMANHQLYTDWLYIWWIAYTNKMHGHIYIVLKESLKQVPIIGWGMQFFNFIFLSRKWENDRFTFKQHLGRLKNNDPGWLVIFPEGTNLSQVTRDKSAAWSQKTGIPDMKHQLLPRTIGLKFCLEQLQPSMNWLYDATIAYEGVPKGGYGQDVFTLKSSFLEGRPPKSVNIFWRRFKIADIPYRNSEAFERWITNRWREKDYILEYFDRFGSFPAGDVMQALATVRGDKKPQHANSIVTEVKGGGLDEFLEIFGPVTTAAGVMSAVDTANLYNFEQLIQQMSLPKEVTIQSSKTAKPVRCEQKSTTSNPQAAPDLRTPAKPAVDGKTTRKLTLRPRRVLNQLEKAEGPHSKVIPAVKGMNASASVSNVGLGKLAIAKTPQSRFTASASSGDCPAVVKFENGPSGQRKKHGDVVA